MATSPSMKVSTSRLLSVPSTRGEPANPAASRWRRYSCTVGDHGPTGRSSRSPRRDPAGHPPPRKGYLARVWVIGIGHRDQYHQQCLTACELARWAAPLEGDGMGKPSAVTHSKAMH